MSDQSANAAGRARIRQILRLNSRLIQKCGSRVRDLERAADRLRDRATIPTREQAEGVLVARYNVVNSAFKDMRSGLADLLNILVDPGTSDQWGR